MGFYHGFPSVPIKVILFLPCGGISLDRPCLRIDRPASSCSRYGIHEAIDGIRSMTCIWEDKPLLKTLEKCVQWSCMSFKVGCIVISETGNPWTIAKTGLHNSVWSVCCQDCFTGVSNWQRLWTKSQQHACKMVWLNTVVYETVVFFSFWCFDFYLVLSKFFYWFVLTLICLNLLCALQIGWRNAADKKMWNSWLTAFPKVVISKESEEVLLLSAPSPGLWTWKYTSSFWLQRRPSALDLFCGRCCPSPPKQFSIFVLFYWWVGKQEAFINGPQNCKAELIATRLCPLGERLDVSRQRVLQWEKRSMNANPRGFHFFETPRQDQVGQVRRSVGAVHRLAN